jgi:glycosyltransferase involved in cell wall biosynthesis
VLKRYPRLSETFILQEILELEARGADLVLFAIMDPGEPVRNPRVNDVRAPVRYINRPFWHTLGRSLIDHIALAVHSPDRYRDAWRYFVQNRRSRGSIKHFMQSAMLARDIQRHSIDHLHAHFAHNPTSLARNASLFTGVPFSFTAHAKDLYTTPPDAIAAKAGLATFVATCTSFNARYLQEILDPADRAKIHTVYHGVDVERFRPPPVRPVNPIPVIVSVGRLVPKKGFQYLIEAAALLRERGCDFMLDIYGTGPLLDPLREQVAAAGLQPVVQFHGSRTQDDLIAVYERADIFTLAPHVTEDGDRDGIPNVILEAMSTGLPAVSTEISGIPEVIESGKSGILVPPADSRALADALESLISSAPLRCRLGEAARARICREFAASENVSALAALLHVDEEAYAHRVHTR